MADGMKCPKCAATFDTPTAAMEHAKRAHGMTPPENSAPPVEFACRECRMDFPTHEALQLHRETQHRTEPPRTPARSVRAGRLLGWGALGGLFGGLGLAGVMAITGNLLNLPVTMLAVIAQAMFGISATSSGAMGAGLAVHLFSSILIGVVLTGAVIGLSRVSPKFAKAFFPSSAGRVASAGLLGGLLVFLVFGLPLMFGVLVPTMHTLMTNMIEMMGAPPSMASSLATTKLNGWMPSLFAGFFLGHLVYGLFVGTFVGVGTRLQLRRLSRPAARGTESPA